jgi:hypothetical protein
MFEPTEREERLAAMAEKAKEVKPQTYDITSKNPKAPRVVHDWFGKQVVIRPGETKTAVPLRPDIAEYLGKGDLTLTASGAAPAAPPATP